MWWWGFKGTALLYMLLAAVMETGLVTDLFLCCNAYVLCQHAFVWLAQAVLESPDMQAADTAGLQLAAALGFAVYGFKEWKKLPLGELVLQGLLMFSCQYFACQLVERCRYTACPFAHCHCFCQQLSMTWP